MKLDHKTDGRLESRDNVARQTPCLHTDNTKLIKSGRLYEAYQLTWMIIADSILSRSFFLTKEYWTVD